MTGAAFALVAPVGGALLARLDLSQEDIVRDAEAQLHRVSTDADLAQWARVWGAPVIARLHDTADHEELSANISAAEEARGELVALESAVKNACEIIRDALKAPADQVVAKVEAALKQLEQA